MDGSSYLDELKKDRGFTDPHADDPFFFKVLEMGGHADERRTITDLVIAFPGAFLEAVAETQLLQTKTVAMAKEAVDKKLVVGNHYHVNNRHELFVARGPEGARWLFIAYWQRPGHEKHEVPMHNGDGCYIPPGVTHAFVPVAYGAELIGYSNKPFTSEDDVPNKIV